MRVPMSVAREKKIEKEIHGKQKFKTLISDVDYTFEREYYIINKQTVDTNVIRTVIIGSAPNAPQLNAIDHCIKMFSNQKRPFITGSWADRLTAMWTLSADNRKSGESNVRDELNWGEARHTHDRVH